MFSNYLTCTCVETQSTKRLIATQKYMGHFFVIGIFPIKHVLEYFDACHSFCFQVTYRIFTVALLFQMVQTISCCMRYNNPQATGSKDV